MSTNLPHVPAAIAASMIGSDDLKTIDLNEPLLKQFEGVEVTGDCVSNITKNTSPITASVKVLSLATGSFVALISQITLWATLWNDDILLRPTFEVIQFSLAWSFWTCLIVFASMSFLISGARRKYDSTHKLTRDMNEIDDKEDDIIFTLEAHYVVGALLSISLTWLVNDLFQARARIAERAMQIHPILTVVSAAAAYALFVRWILIKRSNYRVIEEHFEGSDDISNRNHKLDSLSPTFQMIAATLGTIIGVCSQFILSMLMWRDNMTKPLVDSVVIFSLVWSLATVAITLVGCVSLRGMLNASANGIGNESSTVSEQMQISRVAIRMEASYVSSSLIGICSAWIIIDVLTGMTDQILPSIFMLFVSLVAFRSILICFPEEKCIQPNECNTVEVV
jgi:hypothetical protein